MKPIGAPRASVPTTPPEIDRSQYIGVEAPAGLNPHAVVGGIDIVRPRSLRD